MKRISALVLVLLATVATAADPVKLPKELELLPQDALFMISVDFTKLWDHEAMKGLQKGLVGSSVAGEFKQFCGHDFADIARVSIVGKLPENRDPDRRFIEPEPFLVFTMRKAIDKAATVKTGKYYTIEELREILKAQREDIKNRKPSGEFPPPSGKTDGTHFASRENRALMAFADDRTMVFWNPKSSGRQRESDMPNPLEVLKAKTDSTPLAEGRTLAMQHPFAFAVNMSGMKVLTEQEQAPDDILPLLRADSLNGFAKLNKDSAELTATASFAGKQWAADGEEAAKKLKTLAVLVLSEDVKRQKKREGDDSPLVQFVTKFLEMVDQATLARKDNSIILDAKFPLGPEMQKLLAVLPDATNESAAGSVNTNNLKQIALCFHSHQDVSNTMPSNSYDKDGKPLLSWRVHILPYLEQEELYRQFKLDEPWDSNNNKKLIEKMPKVYSLPATKTKAGHTFYRAFESKSNATARALMVEGQSKGGSLISITDGTSNTFLCVEAAESCVWTKPDDLPFDADGKLPKLGGLLIKDRFAVAMCDGSVRIMRTTTPEAKLKAYITTNGGEVINDD